MIRTTRILAVIAGLALVACGQDTQTAGTTETGTSAAGEEAGGGLPDVAAAALDPAIAGCLDLVGQSRFADAVPVCIKAAGIDPENTDVQAALEKARSESGLAEAEGAIEELKAVGGEEAEGLGAAAEGLGERLQ